MLRDALGDVTAGRSRLLLISGAAGLGKTTLLRWSAEEAAGMGLRSVRAAGWEAIDVPALWIWDEVLRQLGGSIADVSDVPDRMVVFQGILRAIETSAPGPTALLFDDLHAADDDSLLALAYIATAAAIPLLIVASIDPQPLKRAPRRQAVLADLSRIGTAITLSPFTIEEVDEFLNGLTSEMQALPADTIFRATGGNPLFVQEVARMLTAGGELHRADHSVGFRVPLGIGGAVRSRASLLDPHTLEALMVASVIGLTFDVGLLQQILGSDLYALLDRLEEGVSEQFLEETSALGEYRFVHLLVREALYEDLSAGQRMRLHHKVALALDANDDDPAGERLQTLAHHWFKAAQAGDPARALELGRRAAQAAAAQGAFEESERLFKRALQVAGAAGASAEEIAGLEQQLAAVQKPMDKEASPGQGSGEEHPFVFRREGDYWTVRYEAHTSRLKDTKGLRYLAQLLRNPGRELHVLQLVSAVDHEGAARPAPSEGLTTDVRADPLLDERAKREYRSRITELRNEIGEAEEHNDDERAARARVEMEALMEHLSAALGLGGRDRVATTAAERARINVTKVLKEALRRIQAVDAPLGDHFAATVRTGTYMSYTPDPRTPPRWTF